MSRADERRNINQLLIGVIGLLVTLVGWFLADKNAQVWAAIREINEHLKSTDAAVVANHDKILDLQYKTSHLH